MFKIIYEYTYVPENTGYSKSKKNYEVRKRKRKQAYLILDTEDGVIQSEYKDTIDNLIDLGLDIDLKLDRSMLTKINNTKFNEVNKKLIHAYDGISDIVVERLDEDITDEEMIFRGIINGKSLSLDVTEISNDSKDMQKLYVYLTKDRVLTFVTKARYIMLPREVSVFKGIIDTFEGENMNLSEFILDPECIDVSSMFFNMSDKIESIDISRFDLANVSMMQSMFTNMCNLKKINLNKHCSYLHERNNEHKGFHYQIMFGYLNNLHELDLRFTDFVRLKTDRLIYTVPLKKLWIRSDKISNGKTLNLGKELCMLEDLYVNEKLYYYLKENGKEFLHVPNSYSIKVHGYYDDTDEVFDSF